MSVRDLIPWGRSSNRVPTVFRDTEQNPFLALHRQVNRLFDDIFNEFESADALRLPVLVGKLAERGDFRD